MPFWQKLWDFDNFFKKTKKYLSIFRLFLNWFLPNSFSVQGSDGATFNPYIQQKETLWFFNDQLCRSMPLVFQKNVQSAGNMPAYRFGPRKDVFRNNDLENYPQNACFCRDEPLCEITGEFRILKKLIFFLWWKSICCEDNMKNSVLLKITTK